MAVRIRMKKLGRKHRPFFRICAMDQRTNRGGKVLEELGTYDPMIKDTDARAILNGERIQYWIGVGAQPSDKVQILIKKYGPNGTHVDQQKAALAKLAQPKAIPDPGRPASLPKTQEEIAAAQAPAAEPAASDSGDGAAEEPAGDEEAVPAGEE